MSLFPAMTSPATSSLLLRRPEASLHPHAHVHTHTHPQHPPKSPRHLNLHIHVPHALSPSAIATTLSHFLAPNTVLYSPYSGAHAHAHAHTDVYDGYVPASEGGRTTDVGKGRRRAGATKKQVRWVEQVVERDSEEEDKEEEEEGQEQDGGPLCREAEIGGSALRC